jgi:hypothetical protein
MKPTPAQLEAVARGLWERGKVGTMPDWEQLNRNGVDYAYLYARDAWAIIAPIVRAATLDEAADLAFTKSLGPSHESESFRLSHLASDIRRLKDHP